MPSPYSPFPNIFRKRLREGERLIGRWCSLGNSITTEVLGLAGSDWLLLDAEQSAQAATSRRSQSSSTAGSSSGRGSKA